MIKINELLIANGQLVAETLRHLANNEIDSDYFAVTSECESYGTEVDCEFAITDYARQAAVTVDQLVAALEAAERERDELRAEQAEHDEQIARMEGKFSLAKRALDSKAARCDRAEAELARRDAAAGEPIAWQFYDDGSWHNGSNHNNHRENTEKAGYRIRELFPAAPPAVLPTEKPVVFGSDLCQDIENYGYNLALADTRQLGAQQQNVVELYKRKSMEVISGQRYSYVLLEDLLPELEAAGVKWEVKK